MNVIMWIVQIALALLAVAGGAFKVFMFDELAKVPAAASLSQGAWSALGVLEMVCGALLILPAALRWMPRLTPIAATVLALESLGLAVLYGQYSTELVATREAEPAAAGMVGALARVTVRFTSEQIKVVRDAAGAVVEGDPRQIETVIDVWTFERDTRSRDPNWQLVETGAPA